MGKLWIVFFFLAAQAQGLRAQAADSDNDGVPDSEDLCSHTPKGARVWKEGPFKGCSQGQFRDRVLQGRYREEMFRQSTYCEQNLIGYLRRLSDDLHQGRFPGKRCQAAVERINDQVQPYADLGNEYRARFGEIYINTLPMELLQRRLQVCLVSVRAIAMGLDQLDRMFCLPDPEWKESYARVPAQQGPSQGLYSPGGASVTSGNTTTAPNGTLFFRVGNMTVGSNGSTFTHMGNFTFGSNGVTYMTNGNITTGSDGSTFIHSGPNTFPIPFPMSQ